MGIELGEGEVRCRITEVDLVGGKGGSIMGEHWMEGCGGRVVEVGGGEGGRVGSGVAAFVDGGGAGASTINRLVMVQEWFCRDNAASAGALRLCAS